MKLALYNMYYMYIFSLHFLLENRRLDKLDTFSYFVDLRKVFDSLPRDRLWQKLLKNAINGNETIKEGIDS